MPRYYFHLDEADDDDGVSLSGDTAAIREAVDTFGAMIREGYVKADSEMRVLDGEGRRIISLRFSAER